MAEIPVGYRFTKDDFEGLLVDLANQLKEFPTDGILRESGIPEAAIEQVNRIAEAIDITIDLLQRSGADAIDEPLIRRLAHHCLSPLDAAQVDPATYEGVLDHVQDAIRRAYDVAVWRERTLAPRARSRP